jgi:hypothetical protein
MVVVLAMVAPRSGPAPAWAGDIEQRARHTLLATLLKTLLKTLLRQDFSRQPWRDPAAQPTQVNVAGLAVNRSGVIATPHVAQVP